MKTLTIKVSYKKLRSNNRLGAVQYKEVLGSGDKLVDNRLYLE